VRQPVNALPPGSQCAERWSLLREAKGKATFCEQKEAKKLY
jgi:hypothetical protein